MYDLRAALREALLNALIRRDFAITAPVQIRVYEDHLKIRNPAVLPEGWTLEKLPGEHSSQPFNPDVANAFFRAGEIEAWGRGIQRIFETCREAGTPEPQIRLDGHDLWQEFPYSPEYMKAVGEKAGGTSQKTSEKIVLMMSNNPEITISEMSEIVGVTTRSIERNIKTLQNRKRIRRVGGDHGGHWEVLK